MEQVLETVRQLMHCVKVPCASDTVYKDECVFTSDTPFSKDGLCVNLKTLQGVSLDFLAFDVSRNGAGGELYLLQKYRRVAKTSAGGPPEEPQKLAIGVPGGFAMDNNWDVEKNHKLLVFNADGSQSTVDLPCPDLPQSVIESLEAVMHHQGSEVQKSGANWEADMELKDSKYAETLIQVPTSKKISPNPKDWKCEKSGDTQNLWLNLSDGYIGGGRRNWDGSGGSNGALEHFEEQRASGNFFPLVVKLGTITADGADVFSYAPDENDLVKDAKLAEHLKHWGIDLSLMKKSEKSMMEMEVEKNLEYDWSRICESSGESLSRVRGPGLVGLKNLGNSCYLNSTTQLLFSIPDVRQRYFDVDRQIRELAPADAAMDLVTQVSKLVTSLHSERYAPPLRDGDDIDDPTLQVMPRMFRSLIGRNHPEFSSGGQQDAAEFMQHVLEQLFRAERTSLGSRLQGAEPTSSLFEFCLEERLQEAGSAGRVKYSLQKQNMLMLPVRLDDAHNLTDILAARKQGSEEEPKPRIELQMLLERLVAPEEGVEFRGLKASRTTKVATMPRYLLVGLGRYYVNQQWVPSKLDALIPMPLEISLESIRAQGLQPGEIEWLDSSESAVAQQASGVDVGIWNWCCGASGSQLAESREETEIRPQLAASETPVDEETLGTLTAMGFPEEQVRIVLKHCDGNAERAADWLFSHAENLEADILMLETGADAGEHAESNNGVIRREDCDDGPGTYELMGFISHIGKSTTHGHYVCHLRRSSGWFIFDDEKVAISAKPPLDLGYIYLYRRK